MSQREVTKKYNEMLQHGEIKGEVKPNRVNCYKCPCGHITKTIDVDKGVTPFMHKCESCGGTATSTFYNDIVPHQEPTEEWFRPTLEAVWKMRKKDDGMLDHILNGGLDLRKIKSKYVEHGEKMEPWSIKIDLTPPILPNPDRATLIMQGSVAICIMTDNWVNPGVNEEYAELIRSAPELKKKLDEGYASKKKEWYSKLLAKLIFIQQGELDLNEYKKEIEAKISA